MNAHSIPAPVVHQQWWLTAASVLWHNFDVRHMSHRLWTTPDAGHQTHPCILMLLQAQADHGWWASDLQAACYTGWHKVLVLALGIPCILLLCLGIPVVTGALPVHAWRTGQLHSPGFQAKYGFLYWRYR